MRHRHFQHNSRRHLDDVINGLIGKYGPYDATVEYLAKVGGRWNAVPGTDPNTNLTCCARASHELAGFIR